MRRARQGGGSHGSYIFKHALLQDAAYDSLLRGPKRQFHDGIAEGLKEKFPEVVGVPVETLRESLARLESGFFIKGKVATRTLLRRPDVLGMDFDCEGDCKGQCHKCWVRF